MQTLPPKQSRLRQPAVEIQFPNGQLAQARYVERRTELPQALKALGLRQSRPVLVLIGGASNLSQEDFDRLQSLFIESIAPLAEELGMIVVDGGTDAGVIKLMGIARATIHGTFPLVGVAPLQKIHYPNSPIPNTHPLEPNHTHFIFTSGSNWGDESPWIATIASLLSGNAPSATVLMNGGNVSLLDVKESLNAGRLVYVITGTGRLADEIGTAMRDPQQPPREALFPVLQSGVKGDRLALFDLSNPAGQLTSTLKQHFDHQHLAHNLAFEGADRKVLKS